MRTLPVSSSSSATLLHADRLTLGLRARKQLARSAHADFSPTACPHSPADLLREAEQGRIPSLLKIKHQRMVASPFGFFRGAVPIMAADLACHPNTGILTQICGDAHVANLGAFAGPVATSTSASDAPLVFDINDFDETIHGPFEYDLKRLTTSILLAGREAGVKRSARREAVERFLRQYRHRMHDFASMPILDLARFQIHRLAHIDPMPEILAQAERSTPCRNLEKLTEPVSKSPSKKSEPDTTLRFRSEPPLLTRITGQQRDLVLASLTAYARTLQPERRHFLAQYTPIDVAFKVVGTGSIGLRDFCIYFEGASLAGTPNHDPLFLQIKEEPASAYARWLPSNADTHTHQGHRVMDGQRAMQLTSDPFLGYTTIPDEENVPRDYLVRQLNDHKASLDLTTLTADSLIGYADLCGELFARGHARAGDPVTISSYIGDSDRFDKAILHFARAYADKTEKDWADFKRSQPTPPKATVKKTTAKKKSAKKS
jgi:uncharacterized protein (DUF2252 family)